MSTNSKTKKSTISEDTVPLTSEEKRLHTIVWITSIVIIVGILLGVVLSAILSTIPNLKYVEMEFEGFGKIVIEVDLDEAPITSKNFIKLVRSGFYDGLTIFRAQKDSVIQGGKNEKAELNTIKGEFEANGVANRITHTRGVISMARLVEDMDSASSQFFIVLDDSAAENLDGEYAGFGHVVEGMTVVDSIAECLRQHVIDHLGFVEDKDAIIINYAKVIKYNK